MAHCCDPVQWRYRCQHLLWDVEWLRMVRDKVVSFRNSVESESQHAVQSDAPVFEMRVYMTVLYKQLLLPCPDMSLQRDS